MLRHLKEYKKRQKKMMKLLLVIIAFTLSISGKSRNGGSILEFIRTSNWRKAESILKDGALTPHEIKRTFIALCKQDTFYAENLIENYYLNHPYLERLSSKTLKQGFFYASKNTHGDWPKALYKMLGLPQFMASENILKSRVTGLFLASSKLASSKVILLSLTF